MASKIASSSLARISASFLFSLTQGFLLRLQLTVQLLKLMACLHLFGYIDTIHPDPINVPLQGTSGLIHKVVIGFFKHSLSPAVYPDRDLGTNKGSASGVGLIQDGKNALLHEFWQHLTD